MMCELNITELKYLWKSRGNKNYNVETFLSNDGTSVNCILFDDLQNHRKVYGKIVKDPREGEAYHWPRLQHENLAPLLETVALNEKLSIYIFPAIGFGLKYLIHSESFKMDSENFNRKRNYVKDILLALDYLHNKSLCVMNLTERIFCVSDTSDKAVLYNFQCIHMTARVTKEDLDLPVLYQAPELKTGHFDPVAAETWACGIMFLQIFTNDALPSAFIGEEVKSVLQAVKEIKYGIIKEASPAADINFSVITELQSFLNLFLVEDPKLRTNIRNAITSAFLKSSRREELNSDFKSALWKSYNPFEPPTAFDKTKQIGSSHKKPLVSPFGEIYFKEKANCRKKFKEISCTNKFINLKFIPDSDSTIRHLDRSRATKKEKVCVSDENKEKFIAEQTYSSELQSENKPNESLIGDNKTMPTTSDSAEDLKSSSMLNSTDSSNMEDKSIGDSEIIPTTSEIAENLKCSRAFNKTSNSNLEMTPSDFGGMMENIAKNEVCYDSIFAPHKIDDTFKSFANETESSEGKNQTDRSSSDSDISVDSLDLYQNKLEQACGTSREQGFIPDGSDKSSDYDSKMDINTFEKFCASEDEASLYWKIVHSNSVFKIKCAFEQNLLHDRQSFGDLCTRSSTTVKDDNADLDSSTTIENNNENDHQNYEAERMFKNEILMLEANIEAFSQNNVLYDTITPDQQELESPKDALTYDDADLHSGKNGEIKTGDHLSNFDESIKEDKNERKTFNNSQNVRQIDCTNNYHEMTTTDTLKGEPRIHTEETNAKDDARIHTEETNTKDDARIHTEEIIAKDDARIHTEEINAKDEAHIQREETKLKAEKKRSFLRILFTRRKSPHVKKNAENDFSTSIKDNSKNNHQSHEMDRNYKNEMVKLEANIEAFSQNLDNEIMLSNQVLEETNDIAITRDNAAKDESRAFTEETKLKVGKRKSFLKFPFAHKKSPPAKMNAENGNKIETEKIQNNLTGLANEDNVGVFQDVTIMKEGLLDSSSDENSEKAKKRKWTRFFLCSGSK